MAVPDAFHQAAWQLATQDLTKTARRLTVAAYALGVRAAQVDLDLGDLYDPRAQEFAAQFPYQSIRSLTGRAYNDAQAIILTGVRQGWGADETARRLNEMLNGLVPTVEVIARTETNRAANWGRFSGWRKSGVVRAKEFIATLDERVEPDHLMAHGEVVPLDEPFTLGAAAGYLMPPLRPNCRCTAGPVTRATDPDDLEADREEGQEHLEELGLKRRDNPALVKGLPSLEARAEKEWRSAWHRATSRVLLLLQSHT